MIYKSRLPTRHRVHDSYLFDGEVGNKCRAKVIELVQLGSDDKNIQVEFHGYFRESKKTVTLEQSLNFELITYLCRFIEEKTKFGLPPKNYFPY